MIAVRPRPRGRVLAALDAAVRTAPLVLVAAPVGYGKSTAVAGWAGRRGASVRLMSAVVGVDTETQLLAALGAGESGAGAGGQELVRLLGGLDAGTVLVIDDAHLLDRAVLAETVCPDAVLAAGGLRVVLAGTPRLAASFARQRASGRAVVLGRETLALRGDEIAAASGADADVTAGWPLAADLRAAGPDGRRDALAGRLEEVLDRLEPRLAAFVLDAVVLPEADGELVGRVTGASRPVVLLEACIAEGLLLDRAYDARGRATYRWHPVFAAACRRIARRRDPRRTRRIELAASAAMAEIDPAGAAGLAVAGGDLDLAAGILRRSWLRLLLTGDVAALAAACDALPVRARDTPDLLRIRACCRAVLRDDVGAEALARRAGDRMGDPVLAMYAGLILVTDRGVARRLVDVALNRLDGARELADQPYSTYLVGWVMRRLWLMPSRAPGLLADAASEAETRGLGVLVAHASVDLAGVESSAGRLNAAVAALEVADRAAAAAGSSDWSRYRAGAAQTTRSVVHYWRGEQAAALRCLREVLGDAGSGAMQSAMARVQLALLAGQWGDAALIAEARLALAREPGRDVRGGPMRFHRALGEAYLLLGEGRTDAARVLAEQLVPTPATPLYHVWLADLLRRVDRPAAARTVLRRVRTKDCPRHALASALVTSGVLEADAGRSAAARRYLNAALDVATPEGVLAPFLTPDPATGEALAALARSGSRHETLLSTILARRNRKDDHAVALTAREAEILGFLRTRMTLVEIATHLGVAVSTVKTHVRSIYRKLGVTGRREAVQVDLA